MDNQNTPKSGQVNYSSNNIVLVLILIKKKNNKLPLAPKQWEVGWSCFPCGGAGLDLRSMNLKAGWQFSPICIE